MTKLITADILYDQQTLTISIDIFRDELPLPETTKQLPTIGNENFLSKFGNTNSGSHVALHSRRAGFLTNRR